MSRTAFCVTLCMDGAPWNCCSIEPRIWATVGDKITKESQGQIVKGLQCWTKELGKSSIDDEYFKNM